MATHGPLDESSRWTGSRTDAAPPPVRLDDATKPGVGGISVDMTSLSPASRRGARDVGADDDTARGGGGRGAHDRTSLGRAALFPGYRLRPDMRFGPCVTVSPLGRGGMGEVWLARNEAEGRDEAVKVLLEPLADDAEMRRFIREAQAAMSLGESREIVRTYAIDVEDGRLYIRMEHVRGVSLEKHQPREPRALYALLKRMAGALAVGHRRRLVHRDVKPSNFMLRDDGTVKLMDFGLARPHGASTLTQTAAMLGTPAYMSPEQWGDAREVDERTDVYALGVTYYALLAGRMPYDATSVATPHAYHMKVLTEDPEPLRTGVGLPRELGNLVMKAMAKRKEERFRDATDLLHALERIERDPAFRITPPLSEAARGARTSRRRILAVVGALLLVAGISGAGVALVLRGVRRQAAAAGPSAATSQTQPTTTDAPAESAGESPLFLRPDTPTYDTSPPPSSGEPARFEAPPPEAARAAPAPPPARVEPRPEPVPEPAPAPRPPPEELLPPRPPPPEPYPPPRPPFGPGGPPGGGPGPGGGRPPGGRPR